LAVSGREGGEKKRLVNSILFEVRRNPVQVVEGGKEGGEKEKGESGGKGIGRPS